MYYPNQLKTLPFYDYDKIIITVRDQKIGSEMYQAIREIGIAAEKIVAAHIYVGPTTGISLEDFIGNVTQLRSEIKRFIDGKYGNLHYFDPLIEELKKKANEHDVFCRQLKETTKFLSPLENIIFLYILYLANIFDAEMMECLVRSTLQIDKPELLHFLHGVYDDEVSMQFLHGEYLFPEYYILRRAYAKKLCEMYDLHIDISKIRKSPDGKIQKICILHHTLMSHKHSPTLVSIQVSNILAELGYEVKVMPLDASSNISWDFPIFSPPLRLAYYGSREFEEYHKEAYHPNVTIEYTDVADPKEKLQCELDKIAAFLPDLIIDTEPEVSVASYIYSQYFPTLCLPMGDCQSSGYFTYYAVIDRDVFEAANKIFHSIDHEKVIDCPLYQVMPRIQFKYERGNYPLASLDKDDFVLISVGNRIGTELTEEFIDIVCKKLLTKQNIKWLIVGGENRYLSQQYWKLLEMNKITYIPYEDDLPALYQICDMYISPKRQGGGTSVFWAMYYGLPIAQPISPQADAITIIGAENAVGETYEEVIDWILSLWENPEKYAEASEKVRKQALRVEATQKQGWKELIDKVEIRQQEKGLKQGAKNTI